MFMIVCPSCDKEPAFALLHLSLLPKVRDVPTAQSTQQSSDELKNTAL